MDGHAAVDSYVAKLESRDQKSLAGWAAGCAEHVLSCFEKRHPRDARPHKAIGAARAWLRGEIRCGVARAAAVAAHAAARGCVDAAAKAAARAAGHAAATAHMPGPARVAAAYAILAAAAENPDAALAERDWQVKQLDPKKIEPGEQAV